MESTLVVPEWIRYCEPDWRGSRSIYPDEWVVVCSAEIFYAYQGYRAITPEDMVDRLRTGGRTLCPGSYSLGCCYRGSDGRTLLSFDTALDFDVLASFLQRVHPKEQLVRRFGHCEVFNGDYYLGILLQLVQRGNETDTE